MAQHVTIHDAYVTIHPLFLVGVIGGIIGVAALLIWLNKRREN